MVYSNDDRFDRYGRYFYVLIFIFAFFYIITTSVDQSQDDPFEGLRIILDGSGGSASVNPLINPVTFIFGIVIIASILAFLYRRNRDEAIEVDSIQ